MSNPSKFLLFFGSFYFVYIASFSTQFGICSNFAMWMFVEQKSQLPCTGLFHSAGEFQNTSAAKRKKTRSQVSMYVQFSSISHLHLQFNDFQICCLIAKEHPIFVLRVMNVFQCFNELE